MQEPHPLHVLREHGHQRCHDPTRHRAVQARLVGIRHSRARQGERPSSAFSYTRIHPSDAYLMVLWQTALSMTVCNLLVVVTFVYRFLHRRHDREDASTVKSCAELTTIELSEAGWSHETSRGTSLPVCSFETMSPRSSTWSFTSPSPMASKLSGVASEMAGTETMQGEIVQEAR